MKSLSSAILHQLTTALLDKDFFQVGYLLMAYAEIGEASATLKHRLMSWAAIETLSNVPVDSSYDEDGSICCIDNAGAIVSFIQTHLDSSLPPHQYLRQLKRLGVFITDNFAHAGGSEICCDFKHAITTHILKTMGSTQDALTKKQIKSIQLLLLPAQGIKTNLCVWLPRMMSGPNYVSALPQYNVEHYSMVNAVKASAAIMIADSMHEAGELQEKNPFADMMDPSLRITLIVRDEDIEQERATWLSSHISGRVSIWIR